MQIRKVVMVIGFIALSAFASRNAVADGVFGQKSKWGLDIERLQNGTSGEYGTLVGFRHMAYFPQGQNNVYAGYEIHTGTAKGGALNEDNLTYGGLSLGFDGNYFHAIAYDFGILVGYGFGNVTRAELSGSSLAIQPTVALGLIMLSGYRATFSAGYLYMPGANSFSSVVFGIRLEHKSLSTSTTTAD